MFVNGAFYKEHVTFRDGEGEGYGKATYRRTGEPFLADAQPYSPAAAKREYGLNDDSVRYKAFTVRRSLKTGDYVRYTKTREHLVVLMVHEWENHTQLILGAVKGVG